MRATGLIAAHEYTEFDDPDLNHLSGPFWIVWHSLEGLVNVCAVYTDWYTFFQILASYLRRMKP